MNLGFGQDADPWRSIAATGLFFLVIALYPILDMKLIREKLVLIAYTLAVSACVRVLLPKSRTIAQRLGRSFGVSLVFATAIAVLAGTLAYWLEDPQWRDFDGGYVTALIVMSVYIGLPILIFSMLMSIFPTPAEKAL